MVFVLSLPRIILSSVHSLLQVFEISALEVLASLLLGLHVAELDRHQLDLCFGIFVVFFDSELQHL